MRFCHIIFFLYVTFSLNVLCNFVVCIAGDLDARTHFSMFAVNLIVEMLQPWNTKHASRNWCPWVINFRFSGHHNLDKCFIVNPGSVLSLLLIMYPYACKLCIQFNKMRPWEHIPHLPVSILWFCSGTINVARYLDFGE